MKKSDLLIEELIRSQKPKSTKQLAATLNVSTKTINNYINEINSANDTIIFSSKDGLIVDKEKALKYIERSNNIPKDFEDRAVFIIRYLFNHHSETINVYRLCDILFVSYSTIKNDISRMNIEYQDLDVKFVIKNNYLHLDGDEKSKRKLMSKIIFREHKNIINTSMLQDCFPNISVVSLSNMITSTLKKHNYFLNDFSRFNLIIHYCIVLDRMKNGHRMNQDKNLNLSDITNEEKLLFTDMAEQFDSLFNIILSNDEIFELLLIIRANAKNTDIEQTEIFKNHVDKELINYVDNLIKSLEKNFYLDLRDDQFIIPFTLHLNSLLERIKYNQTIANPMTKQIKTNSPVVYDIALYIANDFAVTFKLGKNLSSDEVGFIAIHVGSQIERNNIGDEKLNVILICPDYINISSSIRNKLLYNFGTKITIVDTIGEYNSSFHMQCDLILSTIDVNQEITIPSLVISPFISTKDYENISNILSYTKRNKSLVALKKSFNKYFYSSNFIYLSDAQNYDYVIKLMTDKLFENGYVDSNYKESVFARENSSSTAFDNYAIPHSFEINALNSGVCVAICKKGIKWNNQLVNIVLMIAMNSSDSISFYNLYEAILNLLNNETINSKLQMVKTFDEFKAIIMNS
ncbi:MAG: PTS sugar transporter subunit IIA [Ligilactobacillus salivarius]|nr:PTS sugar transporter subunit IIA [Ligilactobacillus salivarius]